MDGVKDVYFELSMEERGALIERELQARNIEVELAVSLEQLYESTLGWEFVNPKEFWGIDWLRDRILIHEATRRMWVLSRPERFCFTVARTAGVDLHDATCYPSPPTLAMLGRSCDMANRLGCLSAWAAGAWALWGRGARRSCESKADPEMDSLFQKALDARKTGNDADVRLWLAHVVTYYGHYTHSGVLHFVSNANAKEQSIEEYYEMKKASAKQTMRRVRK